LAAARAHRVQLGIHALQAGQRRLDELAGRDGAAANQRSLLGGVEGGEIVDHGLV